LATYLAAGEAATSRRPPSCGPIAIRRALDIFWISWRSACRFHLIRQIDAGADAVQIFDSWASGLPDFLFRQVVIEPTKKIVKAVRAARPDAKIIGFPRAATLAGYEIYVQATGVDAVSLDTAAPIALAAENLACVLQGNLDPIALIAGGAALDRAADEILEAMQGRAHIFNLGHGILPETPIAHVEQLLKRIRG
jgi:uroporphyrinogen decarboxylase